MEPELRKSGISVVGDVPWGTHFCHFYETKQDLLDTLVPYFKAGLESNECCLWVVSDSDLITVQEAKPRYPFRPFNLILTKSRTRRFSILPQAIDQVLYEGGWWLKRMSFRQAMSSA